MKMRELLRRTTLYAFGWILLSVSLLASGCAGTQTGQEAAVTDRGAENINETPVTLHVYNTLGENITMDRAEAYIRRTMPNVTVESQYEIGPKMESAQLAAVKSGGGPEILYTQDYYTYVQNSYLLDLTSEPFLKNYMISALNDAEVGGKVYALPAGNGYISGLMVNTALLNDLGYSMPETQEEFVNLCRQIQERREETGVRPYAFGMLYDESAALVSMPFLLDTYTDSAYVQWLTRYREDTDSVTFEDPAFGRVLEGLEALKELNLNQSGDYLTNDTQNVLEVIRGEAVMCSMSYISYVEQFGKRVEEVKGVSCFRYSKDGNQNYVPVDHFDFVPYLGRSKEDRWLATNGDWYLGINSNITDEATRKACRLFLEYIASTRFAPEYYSASVPVGATTYYRRDDVLDYDFFKDKHPEFYQCLTENSIVKNPYQYYGTDIFNFALRHYLCGQKYYAGLEGASSYQDIGGTEGIAAALEEYRSTGKNRFEVPDRVIGKTEKEYNYVRIYSRSNESALSNLLADALREYTGADLAAINAGALTAGLEEGDITESDLATAMLYGLSNHVVTVRCRGENLISILSTNNLSNMVRVDESGVFGGLVIPSGFTYTMTYEAEKGSDYGTKARVSDICLENGDPIDPGAWYSVTTTDYELGGSDIWEAFTILPQEKPWTLPEGIVLYREFDPEKEENCDEFELNPDTYEQQYEEIMDWAKQQPNIIDAVAAYIGKHSENGLLKPVAADGRIRIINPPERLDPEKNGVDIK